jgi:hypothetical protein
MRGMMCLKLSILNKLILISFDLPLYNLFKPLTFEMIFFGNGYKLFILLRLLYYLPYCRRFNEVNKLK